MTDSAITINISSHNINGFSGSRDFLKRRCDTESHAILAIQEHWLKPAFRKHQGINKLRDVHPKYEGYGTSAMNDKITSTVLKGRPYGGTGFIFSKSLNTCLKPRCEYQHDRVTVMMLTDMNVDILIINAYLPFYDVNNLQQQLNLYTDTIGYIDYVMSANPGCAFILTLDMNCNIYNASHPYTSILRNLMSKFGLTSALDLNPTFDPINEYTRCDLKRGSFTLIDGILLSNSLTSKVQEAKIVHYGDNVSDHSPVEILLNVDCQMDSTTKKKYPIHTDYIPWNTLSDDEICLYRETMEKELDSIAIPASILHGKLLCKQTDHCHDLEYYYENIVKAVINADQQLPRKRHGFAKSFWSADLTNLKQKSIDSCDTWKIAGRPRSGPIFLEKCRAQMAYKSAVRYAKRNHVSEKTDSLYESLASKDSNSFWRGYKSLNGKTKNACRIDNFVEDRDIANGFRGTFSKVYASADKPACDRLRSKFDELYSTYHNAHVNDDLGDFFFTWNDMLYALRELKIGKASGGFIKSQHILLGSTKLAVHLHLLFNGLLQHSYVPQEFLFGMVTPVIKDVTGDASDSSNYRPITLSNLLSQLLEKLILLKIDHLLTTDDLQFGFKRRHSTSHAVFVLRSCIDYYVKHGSSTIVTFLDCSKAFDKVPHHGIFMKLIEKGIPLCYVNLLIYWYSNMSNCCKWNDGVSDVFSVPSGVKQGGILSPRLFTMYIDDILKRLRKRGVGCHHLGIFIGAILFADDLCLIAPSRRAMQIMLDICSEFCSEFGLTFNPKKSKSLYFGKDHNNPPKNNFLHGEPILFVNEWKYLGLIISKGKCFSILPTNDLRNFYASFNSLYNAHTRPSETVLMHLLYTTCIPNLTYAADIKEFSSSDMSRCNTAVNDAIRKIYGFNRWESIRDFRIGLGYPDLYSLFNQRRSSFTAKLPTLNNHVLSHLSTHL